MTYDDPSGGKGEEGSPHALTSRRRTLVWNTIPGGGFRAGAARGGERLAEVAPATAATVDLRGDRAVFLADLHLGATSHSLHRARVETLLELLRGWEDRLVILAGDIFDAQCLPAPGRARQPQWGRIAPLLDQLAAMDVVLLPGNHDPAWWYDQWAEEPWRRVPELRVQTVDDTFLAIHGNRAFRDTDEAVFGGIQAVHALWVTLFFAYEGVGVRLGGRFFLRAMYAHINRAFSRALPGLRSAYACDAVMLGHSHLDAVDPRAGLYVSALPLHGRLAWLEVDPDGHVWPREVWHSPVSQVVADLHGRIGNRP